MNFRSIWNTDAALKTAQLTHLSFFTHYFFLSINYLFLSLKMCIYGFFIYGYLFIEYCFDDHLKLSPNADWHAYWAHSMALATLLVSIAGIIICYRSHKKKSPFTFLTKMNLLGMAISFKILKQLILILMILAIGLIVLFRLDLGFFPPLIQAWNNSFVTFAKMYGLDFEVITKFLVPPKASFGIFSFLLLPVAPLVIGVAKGKVLLKLENIRIVYFMFYHLFSFTPLVFSILYHTTLKKLIEYTNKK